jgi:hypothetical protein
MSRHQRRAEQIVITLGHSYRDARILRRSLQRLIERADTADEGWLELVAGVEEVEYRLRCVLRAYEDVLLRAPGLPCEGGTSKRMIDC